MLIAMPRAILLRKMARELEWKGELKERALGKMIVMLASDVGLRWNRDTFVG
jgi:hypothetical protein